MKKSLKFSMVFLIPFIFASLPKSNKVKEIAKDIKQGKIDVGEEYGMEPGKRWHKIHSEILEIDCDDCHIEKYDDNYIYQRKNKVPVRGAPGVVKSELCLECHRKGGPAKTELYGKK
jgi:hypothetical protein